MSADKRGVTAIRWIARVWSVTSVGFVLLMFVGSGLAEGFNPAQFAFRDWVGLLFFPFGVCLGMIVAWQAWERWRQTGQSGALLAFLGAVLFVVSDSALAVNRFRGPYKSAQALILSTYFAAQWLIARSVEIGVV